MQTIRWKLANIKPIEENIENLGLGTEGEDDSLEEGRFRRTPKRTRTTKTTATTRRKWRREKRKPRSKALAKRRGRKPRTKKRVKLLRQWRNRRNIPKRPVGRGGRVRLSLSAGNERVANLMEEVSELVSNIERDNQTEMIKAFANAALVAESLSGKFIDMAEAIADEVDEDDVTEDEINAVEGLAGLAEQFDSLAKDAADYAEALDECVSEGIFNEEVNVDVVEEDFREMMKAVLDGCDIYAALSEGSDEDEPEVSDEEAEGEADGLGEDKYAAKKYPGAKIGKKKKVKS